VSNGRYGYAGRGGYAGASGHYEYAVRDGQRTGVPAPGAVTRTSAAGAIWQPVSEGHYEPADRSGRAGAIRRNEHAIRDDRSAGDAKAGATKYTRMAGVT